MTKKTKDILYCEQNNVIKQKQSRTTYTSELRTTVRKGDRHFCAMPFGATL